MYTVYTFEKNPDLFKIASTSRIYPKILLVFSNLFLDSFVFGRDFIDSFLVGISSITSLLRSSQIISQLNYLAQTSSTNPQDELVQICNIIYTENWSKFVELLASSAATGRPIINNLQTLAGCIRITRVRFLLKFVIFIRIIVNLRPNFENFIWIIEIPFRWVSRVLSPLPHHLILINSGYGGSFVQCYRSKYHL